MANASGNNRDLAKRAQEGVKAPDSPERTIAAYLKRMAPQFADVLPKHVDIDRLMRVALTTIRTNPKLLECEVGSLMAAVMQASMLGLEPGILGHCYLLPFRNNKENRMDVQFIIGYRGMIDLARRSGNIQSIAAHEVYENDFLELEYGLQENLKHVPWHIRTDKKVDDPGDVRGAYMVAKFNDGGYYIHYMPKAEIENHRKRSKAANNGPWVTDTIEMYKKTVVRSAWKWLPISIEVAQSVESTDGTAKRDITDQEPIDIPFVMGSDEDFEEPQEPSTDDAAREGLPV